MMSGTEKWEGLLRGIDARADRRPSPQNILFALTALVTQESACIGLLMNFPTRSLPKAALVLTKARQDWSFGRRSLDPGSLSPNVFTPPPPQVLM